MDSRDWQTAKELLADVAHLPRAGQRAYIEQHCDDTTVRAELLAMLETPAALSDVVARAGMLVAGSRLGPYEIVGAIGAGGMGEVYRARDTRLGRDVAIKVLPMHAASDPIATARFAHEARAIAALNHPHICAIYDVGEDDGVSYLVMELLEGEGLDQRLRRGPMDGAPLLAHGVALADALAAAHARGIIHRDLKPSNIFLTAQGGIKILDFGIAKQESGASPRPLVTTLTADGAGVGTLAYMSPEQLRGEAVDQRTDVFSLGAVLYEMACGRPAFRGASKAALSVAILRDDPAPIGTDRVELPPKLEEIVRTALEKDPELRTQTASELRAELKRCQRTLASAPAALNSARKMRVRSRARLAASAAAIVTVVGGSLALLPHVLPSHAEPIAIDDLRARFDIPVPRLEGSWPRISPNGRFIAFGTIIDGRRLMWIRPLDATDGYPLMNVTATESPFWSPDSRTLAFFEDGKLKTVGMDGGDPLELADAYRPHGGAWSGKWIVYTTLDGIRRIAPDGTQDAQLTKVETAHGEYQHAWPVFLPDGKRFLYLVRGSNAARAGLYVGSVDGTPGIRLMEAPSSRVVYSRGYLLFVRDGELTAQLFDLNRLRVTGPPMRMVSRVRALGGGDAAFDVSPTGVLVFGRETGHPTSRLVLYDRAGRAVRTVAGVGCYLQPRFSPDGQEVAAEKLDPIKEWSSIWVYGVARVGESQVVTPTGMGKDVSPVWSPFGDRLAFSTRTQSALQIFTKVVNGRTPAELFVPVDGDAVIEDWSKDGKYLAVAIEESGLWVIPADAKNGGWMVRQSKGVKHWHSVFSPDMHWLAYTSDESGQPEVYVEPFPATGARWQISAEGGAQPDWRADGKELFFLQSDRTLAVLDTTVPNWQRRPPKTLFAIPVSALAGPRAYSVSPNGGTFIVNAFVANPEPPPTGVVLNWPSLLKQ